MSRALHWPTPSWGYTTPDIHFTGSALFTQLLTPLAKRNQNKAAIAGDTSGCIFGPQRDVCVHSILPRVRLGMGSFTQNLGNQASTARLLSLLSPSLRVCCRALSAQSWGVLQGGSFLSFSQECMCRGQLLVETGLPLHFSHSQFKIGWPKIPHVPKGQAKPETKEAEAWQPRSPGSSLVFQPPGNTGRGQLESPLPGCGKL